MKALLNKFKRWLHVKTADKDQFRTPTVPASYHIPPEEFSESLDRLRGTERASVEDILILANKVYELTGRDGAQIGNSLKTILTRLHRPDCLATLEAYGIRVKSLNGSPKSSRELLRKLSALFKTLDEIEQAKIAQQFAGVYNTTVFRALMRNA